LGRGEELTTDHTDGKGRERGVINRGKLGMAGWALERCSEGEEEWGYDQAIGRKILPQMNTDLRRWESKKMTGEEKS
jgi:hypothetical protein